MTQRTTPPFRADHVGSLLRTAPLKEARAKHAKGEIDAAALKVVEDREIEKIVKKQEEVGLKLATDGEFRRSWWHFDFYKGLKGVEMYQTSEGIHFAGVDTKAESVSRDRQSRLLQSPAHRTLQVPQGARQGHAEDDHSGALDISFPSGTAIDQQRRVYPNLDAYFDDVAITYQKAIRTFYDAGCRYLQLDDTAWSMICDPKQREQFRKRGDDPDKLPPCYTRMTNKALEAKPADMVITMHSCRGNFRSTFIASGGYEFVAEELFGKVNIDGYFLEFDTDRAGGFEPLCHLKGDKRVVLGLVTSKSGRS